MYDCKSKTELNKGIQHAKRNIDMGESIIVPTDTVYGIAASPFVNGAVNHLLFCKKRTVNMPPPILISNVDILKSITINLNYHIIRLINSFWPGALTLVLNSQVSISWNLPYFYKSIAVRMPNDSVALKLLDQTGPLAITSANISGKIPVKNIYLAKKIFQNSISVYLNDGDRPFIEKKQLTLKHLSKIVSTIIDCRYENKFRILREGSINILDLKKIIPKMICEN